jgi:hypothetical protein
MLFCSMYVPCERVCLTGLESPTSYLEDEGWVYIKYTGSKGLSSFMFHGAGAGKHASPQPILGTVTHSRNIELGSWRGNCQLAAG